MRDYGSTVSSPPLGLLGWLLGLLADFFFRRGCFLGVYGSWLAACPPSPQRATFGLMADAERGAGSWSERIPGYQNVVMLAGKVVSHLERRVSKRGDQFLLFWLAVEPRKEGVRLLVRCFRPGLAEKVWKGAKLAVLGKLALEQWRSQDGSTRNLLLVEAQELYGTNAAAMPPLVTQRVIPGRIGGPAPRRDPKPLPDQAPFSVQPEADEDVESSPDA